jgi:hypothetical protein
LDADPACVWVPAKAFKEGVEDVIDLDRESGTTGSGSNFNPPINARVKLTH